MERRALLRVKASDCRMDTTTPGRWRIAGQTVAYDWYGPEGGTPFPR
jgi:hypothetical protein